MKRRALSGINIDLGGAFPLPLIVGRPRRRNKQPERALHTHVGKMLKWLKPKCVFFPVPNGLDVGRKLGGILRGQEKIYAGVSDWMFMWGKDADYGDVMLGATCGAIELKIGKQPQSDDQKIFEGWCKVRGVPYRIAKSVDEVVLILEEWGRLPHGTSRRIRGFNPEIKT